MEIKKFLLKIPLAQVVTVPGASYPEKISLIEIAGLSAEPCAGTHLTNTGEVGDQFMRIDRWLYLLFRWDL